MSFVYVHLEADTGNPFYVGIGKAEKRAYELNRRTAHHQNIVAKHGIKIVVVGKVPSWEAACAWEKRLIAGYRKAGYRLVNMTDGGEGLSNPTEEVRAKIGAHTKLLEVRLKMSWARKVYHERNPDKNPMKRPEVREKFLGDKNPMKRPEVQAKCSAAKRGENHPMKRPEIRAKHSAAMKAYWATRKEAAQ